MTTPAEHVAQLDNYWYNAIHGYPRARRNLEELQPVTTHLSPDHANAALHDLTATIRRLTTDIKHFHALVTEFDYPVTGEVPYGQEPRRPASRYTNPNAPAGCTSCATAGHYSPVLTKKIDGRDEPDGELCRWCRDFNRAEKVLPTTAILDRRERGERISAAFVAQQLSGIREQARARAKKNGKRLTKRAQRARAAETGYDVQQQATSGMVPLTVAEAGPT